MWSRNFLSFRNILVFWQLRNFVVSHGLFLKIQGGQAVFLFIWSANFSSQNLLKMFWQRRSKSIKYINSLILKRRKSLRRKAILGRNEKLKFLMGLKWIPHFIFFSFQCIWIVCMAHGSFGNAVDYLSSWIIGICLCWHNRATYVGNDNDRYFLVLIL